MGIFFTSPEPVLPKIQSALAEALALNSSNLDVHAEAAKRTVGVAKAVAPKFKPWRLVGAVVIALALLVGAIWTGQHNLPDISKDLMTSFQGFSGIVLGLLGGEAQKPASG